MYELRVEIHSGLGLEARCLALSKRRSGAFFKKNKKHVVQKPTVKRTKQFWSILRVHHINQSNNAGWGWPKRLTSTVSLLVIEPPALQTRVASSMQSLKSISNKPDKHFGWYRNVTAQWLWCDGLTPVWHTWSSQGNHHPYPSMICAAFWWRTGGWFGTWIPGHELWGFQSILGQIIPSMIIHHHVKKWISIGWVKSLSRHHRPLEWWWNLIEQLNQHGSIHVQILAD